MRHLLLLPLLAACANVNAIEDSVTYGQVTVMKDWFTSAAVVRTSEGPVMIDAGYREGRMEKNLEAEGIDPAEVGTVLLTHGHGDHQGAFGLYENAELVAHELEVGTVELEGDFSVDRTFDTDGGTLTFGDTSIEAFLVTGHTPGSTVYLVDGVLLLGDTCLITKDKVVEPVAEKRSDDPEEAALSLGELARRLEPRADEIEWIVPSHSGGLPGLDALLDNAERNDI